MAADDVDRTEDRLPEGAHLGPPEMAPAERELFARALTALNEAEVPVMVAGAFAEHHYTGAWGDTKDLVLFLRPEHLAAALDALSDEGLATSVEHEHWLAKARKGEHSVDLIFGSGHGQLAIGDDWLDRAPEAEVAGVPARIVPLEELIVSKMYVAERYRFDGADVAHLIHAAEGQVDWERVLELLGDNRGLLLWHLLLFDFVYPGHADALPRELMVRLFDEARERWAHPGPPQAFRGTLLDPVSYERDVERHGYEDRRTAEPIVDRDGEWL
jgi:hypothetical protein